MINIDLFLEALVKILGEKGKKIALIPRWESVKDKKFPAYTRFTLEVSELTGVIVTNRFMVQKTQNLSEMVAYINAEKVIKEDMVSEMIRIMLKYYMYGESVQ
jgi:hypothetical protein